MKLYAFEEVEEKAVCNNYGDTRTVIKMPSDWRYNYYQYLKALSNAHVELYYALGKNNLKTFGACNEPKS
jgi:hypothetical protein